VGMLLLIAKTGMKKSESPMCDQVPKTYGNIPTVIS